MKHFINLKDIPAKDLRKIITDAKKRKSLRKKLSTLEVDKGAPLKGKLLIQMFEKSSLRTRLSFYLAIKQLGGGTLTLRSNELHLGQGGESIADTAKILSTYGDGFMLRTDDDEKVENFKKYLSIPIINGLSPSSHPTQVLSDIFTVEEIKKKPSLSTEKINNLRINLIEEELNEFKKNYPDVYDVVESVAHTQATKEMEDLVKLRMRHTNSGEFSNPFVDTSIITAKQASETVDKLVELKNKKKEYILDMDAMLETLENKLISYSKESGHNSVNGKDYKVTFREDSNFKMPEKKDLRRYELETTIKELNLWSQVQEMSAFKLKSLLKSDDLSPEHKLSILEYMDEETKTKLSLKKL